MYRYATAMAMTAHNKNNGQYGRNLETICWLRFSFLSVILCLFLFCILLYTNGYFIKAVTTTTIIDKLLRMMGITCCDLLELATLVLFGST